MKEKWLASVKLYFFGFLKSLYTGRAWTKVGGLLGKVEAHFQSEINQTHEKKNEMRVAKSI